MNYKRAHVFMQYHFDASLKFIIIDGDINRAADKYKPNCNIKLRS